MREIKFRAFDIVHGIMMEEAEHGLDMGIWVSFGDALKMDRIAIMQFTGLKDKNGVEIYEGDIVSAWIDLGPAGERKSIFEVKISPFGVNIEEWNYREHILPEVIGNIYENKDLL